MAEDHNMIPSNEAVELAKEEDISKRTLEIAKNELGIKARRINNTWYWILKENE